MSGDHNQYQKDKSYLDFECPRCGHCCYVDADDTSQKRVDEKAKREHEWVGLSDDEVSEIIDREIGFNSCWGPEEAFARAIEAKLKEKNT